VLTISYNLSSEHLRGVLTTRCCTNPRLPLPLSCSWLQSSVVGFWRSSTVSDNYRVCVCVCTCMALR